MKHFKLIGTDGVALAALLRQGIESAPREWDRFTERQNYPGSPHNATRMIPLRWLAWPDITAERVFSDLDCVDWPALQKVTQFRAVLPQLRHYLPNVIARAVLVELAPGGKIEPHVDEGLYSAVTDRHHFVVQTNPEVRFYAGGEICYMAEGELFTINKDVEHWVKNLGPTPRVHLILDTWRATGLRTPAQSTEVGDEPA